MIFLTGCTGYVGKHLLRYLCLTSQKIRVCIRDKELTGKQRFQKEIVEHGLFADPVIQNNLLNVEVIEKDLLDLTEEDIEGTVIHCAANVKFTAPLELLLEENVEGLKKIHSLTKGKFIHISTCYVHPKQNGKPEKIKSNLSKKKFICEYAYTKYLAEQYLYDKSNVSIIRLSCVGAPIERLTPMRGGAHLAILELIERSTLPDLWLPEHFVFSSVPVDIICKEIIKELNYNEKELRILQYCAPKDNLTYNISSDEFAKGKKINTIKRVKEPKQIIDSHYHIDEFDVDKTVKKYMAQYGIDNVRGGSYQNEKLTYLLGFIKRHSLTNYTIRGYKNGEWLVIILKY
jgi:thioester reductase-like protein